MRADNHVLVPRAVLATIDAMRGRDEQARRAVNEVLDRAADRGLKWRMVLAHIGLGWLDMGRGR